MALEEQKSVELLFFSLVIRAATFIILIQIVSSKRKEALTHIAFILTHIVTFIRVYSGYWGIS